MAAAEGVCLVDPGEKLVLTWLAHWAGPDGRLRAPDRKDMARKLSLSPHRIDGHIADLARWRLIDVADDGAIFVLPYGCPIRFQGPPS